MSVGSTTSKLPGFIREEPRGGTRKSKTVPPLRDPVFREELRRHKYFGPFATKSGSGSFYIPEKGPKDKLSMLNAIIVYPGKSGTIEEQIGLDPQIGFGTDNTIHSVEDIFGAAALANEVRGELKRYLNTGRLPPDSRKLNVAGF